MILSQRFFNRPTLVVAKDLLGKHLARQIGRKIISGMITEVEAYDGLRDKASHASRGITERNKVMFGPAGFWYVYFTYGMHWLLNIVTGPKGYPAAVLIRGVESAGRRIDGPARVTKFFKIGKNFNKRKAGKETGLWVAAPKERSEARKWKVRSSVRVGVSYAGPVWSKRMYRFYLTRTEK